jgi:hypothetical protein
MDELLVVVLTVVIMICTGFLVSLFIYPHGDR